MAPVWDVTGEWKLALDAGVMTNPDRAAKARMGFVEIGAIYSPSKDLDLALGVIRNVMDGSANTLQATIGLTWRFLKPTALSFCPKAAARRARSGRCRSR